MNPLARLAAWFYDHPDYNVSEEELAVLRAAKDGPIRECDLSRQVGLGPDRLKVVIEALRQKRLLGRNRTRRIAVFSFMGLVDPKASTFDLSDPETVWLSVPGRKRIGISFRR